MKTKNFLMFLYLFPNLIFSQEKFKFPIYPGCENFKTNKELTQCFSDKLWEDLRSTKEFDLLESEVKSELTLYFTIRKNQEVTTFSYASGSDPVVSKEYLERIQTILKDYAEKGLYIKPYVDKGKYENYRYVLKVKPTIK